MIGILGGTFDPVHFGHLRPALDVMQALRLDQVRFLPNREPPHREPPWLQASQRCELLQLALQDVPGFELDSRELERAGKSYMIDTLVSLRQDFPKQTLCLILGMDAFRGLHRWRRWQQIPDYCHLVVTGRPGFDWPQLPELAELESRRVSRPNDLEQAEAGSILLQSVTQLDISASSIREQLQAGLDVRYLMPETVRLRLLEMM